LNSLIDRARKFRKQKSLGQCFLVDEAVHKNIVSQAALHKEKDIVLEIGAGIGFLTEKLVPEVYKLYAVELDISTISHLNLIQSKNQNLEIIRGDFLSLNIRDILSEFELEEIKSGTKRLKIVANIPYQITSKILVHILGEIDSKSPNQEYISELLILVQDEFAKRLSAKPGTKSYGAISLLVQYWADSEYLFFVPAEAFDPTPKVNSALIKIKPHNKNFSSRPKELRRLIKAIFSNRRKTLANALKAASYPQEIVNSLNLGMIRGETFSLKELIDLTDKLHERPS
jgi:16S rRNA (adenine1518-N6/adenine1519-N6)-dimethyltransferase